MLLLVDVVDSFVESLSFGSLVLVDGWLECHFFLTLFEIVFFRSFVLFQVNLGHVVQVLLSVNHVFTFIGQQLVVDVLVSLRCKSQLLQFSLVLLSLQLFNFGSVA